MKQSPTFLQLTLSIFYWLWPTGLTLMVVVAILQDVEPSPRLSVWWTMVLVIFMSTTWLATALSRAGRSSN